MSETGSAGRLEQPAADSLVAFFEAPHLEREKAQFPYFLKVDLAHAVMLSEEGILSPSQAALLLRALTRIERLGVDGLDLDPLGGSMLFQIEQLLSAEVGEDIGGRLHIGRSRLDQGPTVRRLYKRNMLLGILAAINELRATLIERASLHTETVMPGYTCLQHAHPGVFGHYLASFAAKLADDFSRLTAAYERLNLSPLGAAGLSGTSWPINRTRTSELLGFDGLVKNSKLAREAYYAAEVAGGLAMLMSTLNDLATDLHLWSSYEFGFIELADEFCGTSSIFPQKKNPTALEAIKFAAGEAISWPSVILTTFRAEGTGDVVMREAPILDRACSLSLGGLKLMAPIIETASVDEARMRTLASANWSTATSLADDLVRHRGFSFRRAHLIVARFVRMAMQREVTTETATGALLDEAASSLGLQPPGFDDQRVRQAFDAPAFARSRISPGSINPGEVASLIDDARSDLSASQSWHGERLERLGRADEMLKLAIGEIVSAG
ncbi:argininosuccinate lyase [Afifella sp. IM 167]|uniref:argininosuccinate lyase n=1 Tax=Afifella sp. IM 167 TaxID=2033586 RepID=UPI001CCABEDC|nr:argininosuccinate lyase [Afifella sp. IM 167]MBZ8135131.1 argininosuccinate lyase [Afifella sp. IM 167]